MLMDIRNESFFFSNPLVFELSMQPAPFSFVLILLGFTLEVESIVQEYLEPTLSMKE